MLSNYGIPFNLLEFSVSIDLKPVYVFSDRYKSSTLEWLSCPPSKSISHNLLYNMPVRLRQLYVFLLSL